MNKLFGLFLLALAFVPGVAEAANRFAVCATTCTWDNTSTAMWSTTSGGATGASAPGSFDDVILDAATCVGGTTCTITTFAGTITIQTMNMGACTASTSGCILEASTNNTNFSTNGGGGWNNNGAGTRTHNMGNGTYTFTANSNWNVNSSATINAGSSTLLFSNASGGSFGGGGKTYATVSFGAISGSTLGAHSVSGSNTIATLTIAAPNRINFANGITQTVTTMTNVTGSQTQGVYIGGNTTFGSSAISSANNWTCTWCAITAMAFSGGGTFTATNSVNLGINSGITITGGGSGGGRIIGG